MSIEDQRRAAFETWFAKNEFIGLGLERFAPAPILYEQDEVEAMWTGWNAALDSMVIELPKLHETEGLSGIHGIALISENIGVTACAEAIEAAGLKVAP